MEVNNLKEVKKQEKKNQLKFLYNVRVSEFRDLLKKVTVGIVYIFLGYIFSSAELFFGSSPFGFALLCASGNKAVYIYAGLCLSAIFTEGSVAIGICAYTITFLIRILSRLLIDNSDFRKEKEEGVKYTVGDILPLLFSEHICLRMASSAIGIFIISIYKLMEGGFLYYDLWGAIVGMVAAPIATLLFSGWLCKESLKNDKLRYASFCALSAAFVFCTRDMTILGLSLSLLAATGLTLYFVRKKGILSGIIIGGLCGFAYSPIISVLFVLVAIFSGLLFRVSSFFACFSAICVGLAFGIYTRGISALSEIFPALLCASLIFSVVDKLYLSSDKASGKDTLSEENIKILSKKESTCELLGTEALNTVILNDTQQRIKIMCETFLSLSSLFYSLSERMKNPASSDLKQICDCAFDIHCHSCDMRCECWEVEYANSLASISRLPSILSQNGRISKEDISKRMYERCDAMPEIIDQINRNAMLHTQQLIIGDKTEIFALDYEAVSELLSESMVEQNDELELDEALAKEAAQRLSDEDINIGALLVYGSLLKKSIILRAEKKSEIYANIEKIKEILCELCGFSLTYEIKDLGDRGAEALFKNAPLYSVEYAKRSLKAEGEEGFCGDTVNVFLKGEEKFYSLISDGMGSGREAALTSGICSVFLSKLLSSSANCATALKMLNGFLRNKGSGSLHECSATLDLMELDMINGKALFYKGGAAPSYVWRGENLFKLRSSSAPLGIIKELDVKRISFDVGEGDIIVMVSDGVTQSREECPWLFDLLREKVESESVASLCDMIVKRARYEGGNDDISVVVMKIAKA